MSCLQGLDTSPSDLSMQLTTVQEDICSHNQQQHDLEEHVAAALSAALLQPYSHKSNGMVQSAVRAQYLPVLDIIHQ